MQVSRVLRWRKVILVAAYCDCGNFNLAHAAHEVACVVADPVLVRHLWIGLGRQRIDRIDYRLRRAFGKASGRINGNTRLARRKLARILKDIGVHT